MNERGLEDRLQPRCEGLYGLLARMTRRSNDVEPISRQAQIKRSHERPRRKFARHEDVAQDADALTGNHRLDGMQA